MPAFETLDVGVDDGIGRLRLNQPAKLNPLGAVPLREIAEAAAWFDDRAVAVVVVSGAGDRAFSAGFDLREYADGPGSADLGYRMADALEAMDAVSIAAIHGHCIGGGVVLAAACDLRVAADDAVFSIPEIDLGIPLTWGGIPRLVREIGPARTRELVMTGRRFGAAEAEAFGLVNRTVPADRLDAVAIELATTLAAKAPSLLRDAKCQVRTAAEEMSSTADGAAGTALIAAAMADPDARAAAERYLANRKAERP